MACRWYLYIQKQQLFPHPHSLSSFLRATGIFTCPLQDLILQDTMLTVDYRLYFSLISFHTKRNTS